jgi:hypothetical protein
MTSVTSTDAPDRREEDAQIVAVAVVAARLILPCDDRTAMVMVMAMATA